MNSLKIQFPKIRETKLISHVKGRSVREAVYHPQYFVINPETEKVEAICNTIMEANKYLDTIK